MLRSVEVVAVLLRPYAVVGPYWNVTLAPSTGAGTPARSGGAGAPPASGAFVLTARPPACAWGIGSAPAAKAMRRAGIRPAARVVRDVRTTTASTVGRRSEVPVPVPRPS